MNVSHTLSNATQQLTAAGIASARLDAEILLAEAMGVSRQVVMLDRERPVEKDAERRFREFLHRRTAREPVSHITGEREFWSLTFAVGPDVLDPRPDSETLIEAALAVRETPPQRILDLGSGSGCLLIALLHEFPAARGIGLDLSPGAVDLAARNAARNGVGARAEFVEGNWDEAAKADFGGPFDVIVANPPYIPDDELAGLAPELHYEPPLALQGGADGLAHYRRILPLLPDCLDDGGCAIIELGDNQADAVAGLAEGAGLRRQDTRCDLAGIERCIILRVW